MKSEKNYINTKIMLHSLKSCVTWKWLKYQLKFEHLEQSWRTGKNDKIKNEYPCKKWKCLDKGTAEIDKKTKKKSWDLRGSSVMWTLVKATSYSECEKLK